jgi:hypothetical protein
MLLGLPLLLSLLQIRMGRKKERKGRRKAERWRSLFLKKGLWVLEKLVVFIQTFPLPIFLLLSNSYEAMTD